jgi:hypothetical protein
MTQCLPQPPHTAGILRRTEQYLAHRAGRQVLAQIAIDLRGRRLHIFEDLLQQRIVTIRQHLDQLVQRILLVVLHLGRNLHQLGCLTLAVAIRPLAHHIDIAAHRLAIHDRHLAQHQRRAGKSLQCGERVAHAAFQRIDLVDEQDVRHAVVRQLLEDRRDRQCARRRRFAHHHGEIDHGQRTAVSRRIQPSLGSPAPSTHRRDTSNGPAGPRWSLDGCVDRPAV